MRKIILLAIIIGFYSCDFKNGKKSDVTHEKIEDNQELAELFQGDQADRNNQSIDSYTVQKNDSIREARVYELLDSNKVITANDYNNAALIFHHGEDSVAYGMAVKLMKKSCELDSTRSKWLLAVATDRYLLSINKPQIYGTHFKRLENQKVVLEAMDSTAITDAERIECGVETLAQIREKIIQRNKKRIQEYLTNGKSVNDLVQFIKHEDLKNSKYDLSESSINSIGYKYYFNGEKEEALKIFKLNTELYPSGFNAFDSYGECLLDLGDKDNAIKAFEKSLALNPKNENAQKKLSELK